MSDESADDPVDADRDVPFKVRPYALTGGRTRASVEVTVETVILASDKGRIEFDSLSLQYREILSLAGEPLSVAEISALRGMAIGATKVLVGDLIVRKLVSSSVPSTGMPDVETMRRVIDGLNNL